MGVPVNSAWPVSREDISQMKQSLVSKFNDSFSKDLVDTKKVKTLQWFNIINALFELLYVLMCHLLNTFLV